MSRPGDWSAVELDSDPTPGDPAGVARAARHYAAVADAIETAAASLRRISRDADMESEAVTTFVEKSSTVAEQVSKARERYERAGQALGTYATALESAQDEADSALRDARWAEDDIASANRRLDAARESYRSAEQSASQRESDAMAAGMPAPPRDLSWEQSQISRSESDLDEARSRLARACSRAATARDQATRAADRARRDISDVVEHDGLSDSFWDKAANVLQQVADIAGKISAFAGIAALAVGWIPVIGQALAAVLGTVALIAGAISLIANLTLLVGGKGSVIDTILDAVGLATFGLGKAIGLGGRAVYRGAQGAARRSAGQIAGTSKASRAARGQPTHSDSLRTIDDLLGGAAAARMSKMGARKAMRSADRTQVFTARNVLRGTGEHFAGLKGHGATLLDPSSWRAAGTQMHGRVDDIAGSASMKEALLKFTDDADGLRHLQNTARLDSSVTATAHQQSADLLLKRSLRNGTVAASVDVYQTGEAMYDAMAPRPGEPMAAAAAPAMISR